MGRKTTQARHDAAVLPRIRDLEAAGLSLREMADQLQADGFPSPRRGSQWSHVAVIRILERADKAPNQSAATTLNVTGPVHVTGPLTIFTSGPVTITTGEASATAEEQPKDSTIILAGPGNPFALSHPPTREMAYEMNLSPDGVLVLPNPFFLRRRL